MKQGSLKIHAIGLNDKLKNAIDLFFKFSCNNEFVFNSDHPDIIIGDLDNYVELKTLTSYREKNKAIPSILFSTRNNNSSEADQTFHLTKPLDIKLFKKTLEVITISINNQAVCSEKKPQQLDTFKKSTIEPSIKPSAQAAIKPPVINNSPSGDNTAKTSKKALQVPDSNKLIYYYPDTHLVGHFFRLSKKLKREKDIIHLQIMLDNALFIINNTGTAVKTSISNNRLKKLSLRTVLSISIKTSKIKTPWENIEGHEYTMDEFLCKTTLWAAEGRTPYGTNPEFNVALHFWPNLTRLPYLKHAIKICSLWMQQPMSLLETATFLKIPLTDVYNFFSVMNILGLSYQLTKTDSIDNSILAANTLHQEKDFLFLLLQHMNRQISNYDAL